MRTNTHPPSSPGSAALGWPGPRQGGPWSAGASYTVSEYPADDAHAEMLAAVERGEAVMLMDETTADGFRLAWSARELGGRIQCQAWHRAPFGAWRRGAAFYVVGRSLDGLERCMTGRTELPPHSQ